MSSVCALHRSNISILKTLLQFK